MAWMGAGEELATPRSRGHPEWWREEAGDGEVIYFILFYGWLVSVVISRTWVVGVSLSCLG